MGSKIVRFEEIGSTNEYAKSIRALGEDVFVVAKRQSGGRGTKGRSFSSQEGGLYFSKLTFYRGLAAEQAFTIMQGAAAAVCETLSAFGLEPVIKWPNDIYVNGKKICGILIENALSGKYVSSSVVGIGLNVNNALEEELQDIATSMAKELGKAVSVSEAERRLFALLEEGKVYEKYRTYLGFMGQKAKLIVGEKELCVTLLSVDERGNLVVEADGEEKIFSAAEVSLRV